MSARSRSFLPSHLFIQEPSVKKTIILYKGNDISTLETDEEILEVQTESGTYRLYRRNLRQTLQELRDVAHENISSLTSDLKEKFLSTVQAILVLQQSPDVYTLLMEDVRTYFQAIKDYQPGTVSAYFLACHAEPSTFQGPAGCSLRCLASLPENTDNIDPCEDLILHYQEGALKPLNKKQTVHCYIHVQENFAGFREVDIKQLQNLGVETATIIHQQTSNTHSRIESPRHINNLPMFSSTPTETTPPPNWAVFWVVVAIIILLLLILAIGYQRQL